MRDDKIWTQSTATSALLGCSLTSSPFAGKCVPCVEDRKVYIVCLDMPKDLKLDLEDGDGNSFSYTEASEYHFETVQDDMGGKEPKPYLGDTECLMHGAVIINQ